MSAVINTNVASINAQRNLGASSSQLEVSLQRLSSGLRINSAKDDAAGLAISERFTTQIRGLNQAVRNANDGTSLAQSGEGALGELTQNLQRVRELALQSVNATNSNTDRAAIDLEVQQRLSEIDRVASQTQFNGRYLLDGSFGSASFQVGANVGQTISLDLNTSMRLDSIGAVAKATSTVDLAGLIEGSAATYAIDATNLISDYSTDPSSGALGAFTSGAGGDGTSAYSLTFTAGGDVLTIAPPAAATLSAADVAAAFVTAGFATNGTGTVNGFSLDLGAGHTTIAASIGAGDLSVVRADGQAFTSAEATTGTAYTTSPAFVTGSASVAAGTDNSISFEITAPGGGGAFAVTLNSDITSAADLVSAIQDSSGYASAAFTAAVDDDGNVALTAKTAATGGFTIGGTDGSTVSAENVAGSTADGVAAAPITVAGNFSIKLGDAEAVKVADGIYDTAQKLVDAVNRALAGNGQASLNDDGTMSIVSGQTIAVTGTVGTSTVGLAASTEASGSLSGSNVKTVASSNELIQRIDAALSSVSDLRSVFGAIQNRFESAIANMQATSENLTASRSRIQDADFAQETANLTRAQILQQAGIAMLSQANSMPNMVLSLLR